MQVDARNDADFTVHTSFMLSFR